MPIRQSVDRKWKSFQNYCVRRQRTRKQGRKWLGRVCRKMVFLPACNLITKEACLLQQQYMLRVPKDGLVIKSIPCASSIPKVACLALTTDAGRKCSWQAPRLCQVWRGL